jgi:formamidase
VCSIPCTNAGALFSGGNLHFSQGKGEITFCGEIVDHDTNTNYHNDATVTYRNACLNAIEYLKKFGYSGPQAYLLLGAAPIEGRVSGVVDIPNVCCSLYLPAAIFDFDVKPSAAGPISADRGSCAVSS